MATRRKPSAISERGEAFVEAKMAGMNNFAAAKATGYVNPNPSQIASIRQQLTVARNWLSSTTQISRLNVIEGIIDGIEMARMQGDSGNVIKGWTEVGKILGHYAPEVKRVELSVDQAATLSKLSALSDEELLRLSQQEVIEGECQTVS